MAAQSQSEVESSAAQATANARAENAQLLARVNELMAQLRTQVCSPRVDGFVEKNHEIGASCA